MKLTPLNDLERIDYIDRYEVELCPQKPLFQGSEIAAYFFKSSTNIGRKLLYLRNKIVAVLGIDKGDNLQHSTPKTIDKIEEGQTYGLFEILKTDPNTVVMGKNDKHLDFRIYITLEPKQAHPLLHGLNIVTKVQYNNLLGKLYFFFVRPFHKLLVRKMLRKMKTQMSRP